MPTKTSQIQAASGTNWTSPDLAWTAGDGSASFPANTTPNNFLKLTNLSNRTLASDDEIIGVEVQLVGSGGRSTGTVIDGSGFGKGCKGSGTSAQNLAAHTEDAFESIDGAGSTYYGGGDAVSVSVIHDLGSAKTCGYADIASGCTGSSVAPQLHYSSNGTTWYSVSWATGSPGAPSPGSSPTLFSASFVQVTARYWRVQMLNSLGPRIHNFQLWAGGVAIEVPVG